VRAGIALGIAGAILQDLARNPLVAPDVIGISSGASLAAVSLIVFGETTGAVSVPLAALAGALGDRAALYVLAWRAGVQGFRLVLVGIGLAALMHAGISYVLTRGQIWEVAQDVRVAGGFVQRPRLGARLAARGHARGAASARARLRPTARGAAARR